jgi:hypothetical protein
MQSEIEPQITQIVQVLKTVPGCQSIWLLGSTARGEASFLLHPDGSLEVFSDYEFMVVTLGRTLQVSREQLNKQMRRLEQSFGNPNPLFHIDVVLRERRRLAKMAPIIFTFEMRQNAQLLYGQDNRHQLPAVTLRNLNLRDANEILYKRFWAILLYLPKRFFLGNINTAERRVVGYLLCRNALDLTTTLLPHKGILLPTYQRRVEHLNAVYSTLCLQRYFDDDFPTFLIDCLKLRQTLDFGADALLDRYVRVIHYLEQGLHYILDSAEPLPQVLPPRSRSIFNEWGISRGEYHNIVRLTLKMVHRYGPLKGLRWLFAPTRGYLTVGLLAMHKTLIAWRQNDALMAEHWLRVSRDVLQRIATEDLPPSSEDVVADWLVLRRCWANFWLEYNLMYGPYYRQRFQDILEWSYE